jgi:hypothetical protein
MRSSKKLGGNDEGDMDLLMNHLRGLALGAYVIGRLDGADEATAQAAAKLMLDVQSVAMVASLEANEVNRRRISIERAEVTLAKLKSAYHSEHPAVLRVSKALSRLRAGDDIAMVLAELNADAKVSGGFSLG